MKKKTVGFRKSHYHTSNAKVDALVEELLLAAGEHANDSYLREMITTVLRIREDEIETADIKLINTTLKELWYSFKVFQPYRHIRKVAIFGSARTPRTAPDYKLTIDFAKRIVKAGWMVVTGAASGIMSAGNEGAGRANSFGVNIKLPFEQEPNPTIANDSKLINFKYFFTRKLIFIRESDATVLFPGGFGTHDEGFETLTLVQTGKASPRPMVCIDPPKSTYWKAWRDFLNTQLARKKYIDPDDLGLVHFTHDAQDAVRYVTHFYHNYHSSRYIDHRLVMRLKRPLKPQQLARLNRSFKSILKKGKIEQHFKPFEEEENEPHTFELARLAFYFNRRHFAKLMQLIDAVNET